jgi:hypothetical protein
MSRRLARGWLSACILLPLAGVIIAPLLAGAPARAQAVDPGRYDIGSPTLWDIWVDGAHGSDSASGDSRSHALRTISSAWDMVPSGATQCSLKLESDVPVVADRPMYFAYTGKDKRDWDGGHCVAGARTLANEYMFAEGTTRAGFDEWLTLQNPGDAALEVQALYEFAPGQGAAIEKTYQVAARHRRTVFVPAEVGAGKDVAVKLTSSSPFLAERPMYFDYAGKWDGGHCLIGAAEHPAWYFAEGYTGPGFDEWLCLWNPGDAALDVEVSYFTREAGALPAKTLRVPAGARLTIKANDHAGPGYELSARLRAPGGAGLVAERPMYFDYYGIDGGSVNSGSQ